MINYTIMAAMFWSSLIDPDSTVADIEGRGSNGKWVLMGRKKENLCSKACGRAKQSTRKTQVTLRVLRKVGKQEVKQRCRRPVSCFPQLKVIKTHPHTRKIALNKPFFSGWHYGLGLCMYYLNTICKINVKTPGQQWDQTSQS